MRVLFSSTRGAGHFNPLVPVVEACRRRGHELLVAGPPSLGETVDRAGYPFWEFADPPADELGEVWSRVPTLSPDEQNEVVIGDIFGRLNTAASLPRLREACEQWRPDVVVREPAEFGSALAAQLHGIPQVRLGIGLAAMEELSLPLVAGTLDELRHSVGLPVDPDADMLRASPLLTSFPASLEDPSVPAQPDTLRFHDPAWDAPSSELPDWWASSDAPLVYVTFGSVAGGMELAVPVYRAAIEAVGELPLRVLLTIGNEADPSALGTLPTNVHVEPWVPQADVLAHAAAVVCHGGAGSTLGALAAGLPLVVVPLFADQPYNARRVAAVGAGAVVVPDATAIREAVQRVLDDKSYGAAARALAAELRAQPPVDAVVERLEQLA